MPTQKLLHTDSHNVSASLPFINSRHFKQSYSAMTEEQPKKIFSVSKQVLGDTLHVFETFIEGVASGPFSTVAAIVPFMELLLDNVDSKETVFTNKQFQKLNDQLENVSRDIKQINEMIKRRSIDVAYYQVERNLTNQFRHFKDIFLIKDQKIRDLRTDMFKENFDQTHGKNNLDTLYDAVMGKNMFGESVLEIALNYEQKSRMLLENFCAMLKKLFCIGLIALLGHERLTQSGEEKKLAQEWDVKMKEVQSEIDGVIKKCINDFPKQAEVDAEYIVKEKSAKNNQELADLLKERLKNKFYWVSWLVLVFDSPTGLFTKKTDFHSSAGKSWFKVAVSDETLNVVISYSASPETLDKTRLTNLVLDQNTCILKRPSMASMAEQLFATTPHCVVHTVKTSCKDMVFSYSFSDEQYYYKKFKNFKVFFHSETGRI